MTRLPDLVKVLISESEYSEPENPCRSGVYSVRW